MNKQGLIWGAVAGLAALLAGAPGPARAERAPAMLAPAGITILNRMPGVLSCTIALAHWNSVSFGALAPGAQLAVPLLRDAATGALYLANDAGRPMAVESLWCASATARAALPLPRHAGAGKHAGAAFVCRPAAADLACKEPD